MVQIKRGFTVKEVNDYKITTVRREREKNGKKIVEKLKKSKPYDYRLCRKTYPKQRT